MSDLEDEWMEEFKGGTLSINDNKINEWDNKNNYPQIGDNNDKKNINLEKFNVIPTLNAFKLISGWWKNTSTNVNQATTTTELEKATYSIEDPQNYFTFREEVIAKALFECKEHLLNVEIDGQLKAAFLLTEISTWNSDKERLILLATNAFVVIKYDFIALKTLEYRKVLLKNVDKILIGNLVYPQASLIPRIDGLVNIFENFMFPKWNKNFYFTSNRNQKGVRIYWKQDSDQSGSFPWNPFKDAPYCTLTFHPLFFNNDCNNEDLKNLYNLEMFIEKLNEILNNKDIVKNENILLENYVGIASVIHNRNSLGFFKVRGKFSF